jgi:hypothetical protein
MAYDHLGTFNKSQLDRFMAFARSQIPLVSARIQHLQAEIDRIGTITFKYDKGVPLGLSGNPSNSYLAKLLAAYEVLGGNPFIDLRVRLKTDPVFKVTGDEATSPAYMSNGEVIGAKGLADGLSAEMFRSARTWVDDTLQARFERLERKIRRAVDYSDQLKDEVAQLKLIQQTTSSSLVALTTEASNAGSLESISRQLYQLLGDHNYRAIFDDGGKDPYGFTTYAPFSAYDAVPSQDKNQVDRTATSPQRQNTGFVGPGEKGTA